MDGVNDSCFVPNPTTGEKYIDVTCVYPHLEPIQLQSEMTYDSFPVLNWMKSSPFFPLITTAIYIIAIFGGERLMKNRESLNWRNSLSMWNLLLTIFSFLGFIRLLPYCLHSLYYMPTQELFCRSPRETYLHGSTGLWTQLFALSKFPELIDTFFIVINKKKLILLHWYHHVSVLLMAWYSYAGEQPLGIYFCLMNYFVHSIMYFYYFLMAVKRRPNWFNPMVITCLQIAQMVFGVAFTVLGVYFYKTVPMCSNSKSNLLVIMLVYASYLLLFCKFFVGRYGGYLVKFMYGSPKRKIT